MTALFTLDAVAGIVGARNNPDAKPVLMTEKDAVKCRHAADDRHWYVPVSAGFDAPDAQALLDVVVGRIDNRGGLSRGSTYE